jgi:hypothetical protein
MIQSNRFFWWIFNTDGNTRIDLSLFSIVDARTLRNETNDIMFDLSEYGIMVINILAVLLVLVNHARLTFGLIWFFKISVKVLMKLYYYVSWSGACTPDNVGPVTCAMTRNDREDVADREQVADREDVADRKDAVDIRVLEIETKIAFFRDRK